MIAMCRDHFPAQEWQIADMRTLALGRTFNGVLAWDSFFHLAPDDQRRMFPLFRDHAAPRAALMFTSGPSHGEAIAVFTASRCTTQASTVKSTVPSSMRTVST